MSAAGVSDPQLPPFDYTPKKYNGPSAEEIVKLRKTYLNPALFFWYRKPLLIAEGKGQYVFDGEGRRYLDCFAGIVTISVGHCHPKIVEAGQNQMGTLMHTTNVYLNPQIALFAQELIAKMPKGSGLDTVYFTNSGSEANDLAILMARAYTGAYDVISLRNGYHGGSSTTRGLTALNTWKYPVPQGFGVHHALNPNQYRGPYGYDDPDAAEKYANDVKDLLETATPKKVAGFIAEYIQGVGGSVVLPDGYLEKVYSHIHDSGGLCIADEVQTGFGRMGTHFWGFETQNVTPDIVTMAKGIGNGVPLAAVVTRREIAQSMSKAVHINTYGGNAVSCAIGRAVLKVLEEEKVQANSLARGEQFKAGLEKLKEKFPIIGEVRGKGLMLGMELVKDRITKEPAAAETNQIFERCKDLGLILGKGGLKGNVFRIKPPMIITEQDVCFALAVMDKAFSELSRSARL